MKKNPKKLFKSGFVLSAGAAVGALCRFARNVLVARLLSVEDFGIALTFAMTVTFVEMASNMAIDRLLVQSKEGDEAKLQKATQLFEFVRGLLSAFMIFAISPLIAKLFDLEHLTWAYQLVALVPLIRGLINLDTIRFQREMNFLPSTIVEVLPQIVALCFIPLFAIYFADYRLMIAIIFTEIFLQMILSHAVSKRSYGWSFSKEDLAKIFKFGWPLLINSFLLFAVYQGDRAVVGGFIDVEALGWFGAVFALTLFPALIINKVVQSYFLPRLSRAFHAKDGFQEIGDLCISVCGLLGFVLTLGFVLAGGVFIEVFYGAKYSSGATVVGMLGVMQGFRLIKAGPNIVGISMGKTQYPLYSNLLRCVAIPAGVITIFLGWGVWGVVLCGTIFEGLAALLVLVILTKTADFKLRNVLNFYIKILIISVILGGLTYLILDDVGPVVTIFASAVVGGILVLAGYRLLPNSKYLFSS